MSTTLRSAFRAEIGWTWREQLSALAFTDSNRLSAAEDFSHGGGDGQADRVWHALEQTLAAGQATYYDLTDLPQSLFGGTIRLVLASVKALLVVNRAAVGGLRLGGAGDVGWIGPLGSGAGTLDVPAGSPVLLVHRGAGWPITSEHKLLKLQALGSDSQFDLVLLGAG